MITKRFQYSPISDLDIIELGVSSTRSSNWLFDDLPEIILLLIYEYAFTSIEESFTFKQLNKRSFRALEAIYKSQYLLFKKNYAVYQFFGPNYNYKEVMWVVPFSYDINYHHSQLIQILKVTLIPAKKPLFFTEPSFKTSLRALKTFMQSQTLKDAFERDSGLNATTVFVPIIIEMISEQLLTYDILDIVHTFIDAPHSIPIYTFIRKCIPKWMQEHNIPKDPIERSRLEQKLETGFFNFRLVTFCYIQSICIFLQIFFFSPKLPFFFSSIFGLLYYFAYLSGLDISVF